jgi:hypothetical protein
LLNAEAALFKNELELRSAEPPSQRSRLAVSTATATSKVFLTVQRFDENAGNRFEAELTVV